MNEQSRAFVGVRTAEGKKNVVRSPDDVIDGEACSIARARNESIQTSAAQNKIETWNVYRRMMGGRRN